MDGYRGKYWDDLTVGDTFWSTGRTITESDVSAFSALSGDYNPLHVDAELGRGSVFGERVPHGPLGILFALGGYDRIGIVEGVGLAFLDLRWRYVAPIRIGDTLKTKVVVQALKQTSKPDRGVLTMHVSLHNQRGEEVQEGEHTFLIRRREGAPA